MGSVRVAKGAIRYDLEAGKRRIAAREQQRARHQMAAVAAIAGVLIAIYIVRRVNEPDTPKNARTDVVDESPHVRTDPSRTSIALPRRELLPPVNPPSNVARAAIGLAVDGFSAILGTRRLAAGFWPHPLRVSGSFGGPINIGSMKLASGCVGLGTALPTWLLEWTGEPAALALSIDAKGDTALVIRDPAGVWHCNDDSNSSQNPMVAFSNAPAGYYRVWVTSYTGERTTGTLSVVEGRRSAPAPQTPIGTLAAESLYSELGARRLAPGFSPSPLRVSGQFGGPVAISALHLGPECVGHSTATPTWILDWAGSSGTLNISASGFEDTALLIRDPVGAWRCSDDANGSQDPSLSLANAPAGMYRVWVASYGGRVVSGSLQVSEQSPRTRTTPVAPPTSASGSTAPPSTAPRVDAPAAARPTSPSPAAHSPATAPAGPSRLSVRAPFPVQVEANGKTLGAYSPVHDIVLPAGRHTVELTSPAVFLRRIIHVDMRPDETRAEQIPDAVPVQVAAIPANGRVRINGWYAGTLPASIRVAQGSTTFEFEWPAIGRTLTINRVIDAANQMVLVQAPR